MDGTIVNVTLPIMESDFKVTMAMIEWVVTGYLMIVSAIIIVLGVLENL